MSDKRTFLDKLLRRTQKTVLKKDDQGQVTGQTIFQYDKSGEIIAQTDTVLNRETNQFQKAKHKTYTQRADGSYDPDETFYYDDQERVIKERKYDRDASGMLCCHQIKYNYPNGEQVEISRQTNSYDAGLWTLRSLQEVELDETGHIVKRINMEYSDELSKPVCTKEKTYVRTETGEYDPLQTIYRDLSDRITTEKRYYRDQTDLDDSPLLFGEEKKYAYTSEGERYIEKERKMYHIGGILWGSMADLEKVHFQKQLEKLALVHITKYMPTQENGHWCIQSTAQATDFYTPRNRVHFTIGHHVDSHYNGNWDQNGIMIVAPLKGAIDLNGNPLGMSSVDTFFETTPTQKLIMPSRAVVFVPAPADKDLNGGLSRQEGSIIYYKHDHFTEKEKEKIFLAFKREQYSFERKSDVDGIELNDREREHIITKENIADLPDSYCSVQIKRLLLEDFLKKQGYYTNADMNFSTYETDRGGCGLVSEVGEKLGCRWSDVGNKLDHGTDFFANNGVIVRFCNQVQPIHFIMHSDEYQITGITELDKGIKEYHFRSPHHAMALYSSHDDSIEDGISRLQHGVALKAIETELSENAEQHPVKNDDKDSRYWSPAFKATYDIWAKRTIECLSECSELAKGFDFKAWQERLDKRLADYDAAQTAKAQTIIPLAKQGGRS